MGYMHKISDSMVPNGTSNTISITVKQLSYLPLGGGYKYTWSSFLLQSYKTKTYIAYGQ
jgi:hypothetical protein